VRDEILGDGTAGKKDAVGEEGEEDGAAELQGHAVTVADLIQKEDEATREGE
jgi:hypothetical protein